jgi:DNA-binding XRE family transcriptional regulator
MNQYKVTIKAARINANMLQATVAKELKISQKTLTNWENGKTHPTASALLKMCELYKVPLDLIILP